MRSNIGQVEIFALRGATSIGVRGPDVVYLETGVVLQAADGSAQWELRAFSYVCGSDPEFFSERSYIEVAPIGDSGQLHEGMVLLIMREGGKPPALLLGTCVFTARSETYTARMTIEECNQLKGTWTSDVARRAASSSEDKESEQEKVEPEDA